MIDAKKLQGAVGAVPDGIIGRGTCTALFRKCGATADMAQELAIAANRWFDEYGILENELRLAHFLAQLIHESGSFRYMEELASGKAYEGRKNLGNTQAGDGVRYKGRGPIQLTGRSNYRTFGRLIGIDLERHPEVAALPSIGMHTALEYWKSRDLNGLADADNVKGITLKINGGMNGLDDRKKHLAKVKAWWGREHEE